MEQEFVDADPMDGKHWGMFGDETDQTAWTVWDDIYAGEQLPIAVVLNSTMLNLRAH